MTQEGFKRKLAAILSADVVGYSRLMENNEEDTIHTLNAYRKSMSTLVQQHRGRIVDATGDNLMAEFASAVDSVNCAMEIQEDLAERNAGLLDNRKMEFRIGVNVGDVVEEGDRIYGDGVNIASRVESLAEAGGICISGRVYDQVENKLNLEYGFMGEHSVKNISKPIRVYKLPTKSVITATDLGIEIEPTDIPSIAVLPFVNMSGDPSQEYFSDGLTEQIITGISKIRRLLVIARNSTFAYKGKAVKVQKVGQELGVRYVLEGSVQKSGDRLRITAQLVEAKNGHHLWAENFDRKLEDIFDIQDEITMKIMDALSIKLTLGEQWRRWAGGTTNFAAFNECILGLDYFYKNTEGDNSQARLFFETAIELDANYANAYVWLAQTHVQDIWFGFSKSPLESLKQAEKLSQKALELNDSIGITYSVMSQIYLLRRQHEKAIEAVEKAVSLNPNGASAHLILGLVLMFSGRSEEALELQKKAIRLNPIPEITYIVNLANAYLHCGQYDKAIALFKKATQVNPDHLLARLWLTVCLIFSGRRKEAFKSTEKVLKINPKYSLEYFSQWATYKYKSDLERMVEALRKAGIPEHSPKER